MRHSNDQTRPRTTAYYSLLQAYYSLPIFRTRYSWGTKRVLTAYGEHTNLESTVCSARRVRLKPLEEAQQVGAGLVPSLPWVLIGWCLIVSHTPWHMNRHMNTCAPVECSESDGELPVHRKRPYTCW